MFFYIKKNWIDFVSYARAGLVENIGKFIFFQLFHTFLATKQNYNKPNNKKKFKTFSIIFSLLGFILKKTKTLFFFPTFPHFLSDQTQPHHQI